MTERPKPRWVTPTKRARSAIRLPQSESSLATDRSGTETPRRGALATAFRSPYVAFCIWIVVGSVLLQLRWSSLFEAPRADFWLTLVLAFIVFFVLATSARALPPTFDREPARWVTVAVITVYFVLAYAASGGVPLLLIIQGAPYDIYSFGLPGLHVAAISYTGYFGVRLFRNLVLEPKPQNALMFVWILGLLVSMGSRSALSFLAFACLVVFFRAKHVGFWGITFTILAVGAFLFAFGSFGDTRLSFQIEQATGQAGSSTAIVNYSRASPAFEATGLSSVWLWPYLYLASPLSNLNSAFAYSDGALCGQNCNIGGLVLYELLPDAVGAPIGSALGVEPFDKTAFLVSPDLTASTTFGPAVGYAGLVGAIAVLIVLITVGMVVIRAVRGGVLQEEALAIIATFYFFAFFANMLAYSALFLQLLWVTLDALRYRRRRQRRAARKSRADAYRGLSPQADSLRGRPS